MKDNKQKQLFTELTPEEGAAVSGGIKYEFVNRLNSDMPFTVLLPGGIQKQQRLKPFNQPGDKVTLDLQPLNVTVLYDSIQGQGFSVASGTALPGINTFEIIGGQGSNNIF